MNLDFLNDENINTISRALTHLVFRNGAVENIHADGKLSQEDMKTLNKDVQNRIAGLLVAAKEGQFQELAALYGFSKFYGSDWDECEPYSLDMF